MIISAGIPITGHSGGMTMYIRFLTGRSAAWNLTGWRLTFTVSAITAERSRNRCITGRRRNVDIGMRFYWLTAGKTIIFRSTGRNWTAPAFPILRWGIFTDLRLCADTGSSMPELWNLWTAMIPAP